MKIFIALILGLFTVSVFAERLSCTTRFLNIKTSKGGKAKICGAVTVPRALDNGIKYRKRPRFCKKFIVEFFSIRERDESKFTVYCKSIFTKNCYMVRVHDDDSHEGLAQLSAHVVFASIKTMPTIFSLNTGALGRKRGLPGPGRLVRLYLSCRKSK
jgi:hypothetical protein